MTQFRAWPKTPRWNRTIVVTEKIDGTNACVIVTPNEGNCAIKTSDLVDYVTLEDQGYWVQAQSRKRLITVGDDNHGFAQWVEKNSVALVEILGPGYHYGEWWGQGIQRRYGMDHKRFSLFNVGRWNRDVLSCSVQGLDVVPTLFHGTLDHQELVDVEFDLREQGSLAAEQAGGGVGFPAEGYMIWHSASRQIYKVLLEGDDISKTEAGVG